MQKQITPREHGIACVEYTTHPRIKFKITINIPTNNIIILI
jgi:hypothetical protein